MKTIFFFISPDFSLTSADFFRCKNTPRIQSLCKFTKKPLNTQIAGLEKSDRLEIFGKKKGIPVIFATFAA
jgi:hypothetical protein